MKTMAGKVGNRCHTRFPGNCSCKFFQDPNFMDWQDDRNGIIHTWDRRDGAKLFARIAVGVANPRPSISAFRALLKLLDLDQLAQDRCHTTRMGGIASSNQSIDHISCRNIIFVCSDKVNDGVGHRLAAGNRLTHEGLESSNSLPQFCPLAIESIDLVIEHFEFLPGPFNRFLICIVQFIPLSNYQSRRIQ